MSQLTALTANEISVWLARVTQAVDRGMREPARGAAIKQLLGGLDDTPLGLSALVQLALLDDCLRVAHLAIDADGRIDPEELARVADLVRVSAPIYAAVLKRYASAASGEDVAAFLQLHRTDRGPFGNESKLAWRGLALVRRLQETTRNAAPLRDHERMLARVMDEVFDGRSTEVERAARRKLRDLVEPVAAAGVDPRAAAFCREDGPEVFASVAHGAQIHDRDPFDVESIHAEAREVFQSQLERATTPHYCEQGLGRTLLILGESGAGKTHLLRGVRAQVHTQRRGYVGYMQMATEVGDYVRYVLRNFVDSLERPYDPPALAESGLNYLSDGLVEGRVAIPPGELERLRTEELGAEALDRVLGPIIDRIVRTDGLSDLEPDLLHALLLLQRRDPALQRRVVKYLRCEPLGTYDRQVLGGLAPRDQPEDPLRTLRQLAAIMYELQTASMTILVDQIEDTVPDGATATRLQQAFDQLRAIADSIPSAVVVISCLTDVYDALRPKLTQSLVDRLEHDPVPVRLTSQREPHEIEEMLARRLEHLYASFDVPWREDDPLYPFTPAHIEAVGKLRARDCLAKFREYHATCIARKALPASPREAAETSGAEPALPGRTAPQASSLPHELSLPPVQVATPSPEHAAIARRWNDALVATSELPEDDEGILSLVEAALAGAAREHGLAITSRAQSGRLVVEGIPSGKRVVAICNRGAQGGHLGNQLAALRHVAADGTIVFALRCSDWKFKPKTRIAQQLGEFNQAGGSAILLTERDLRAVAAMRALEVARPDGLDSWRVTERPLSQLGFVREILGLDHVSAHVSAHPSANVSTEVLRPSAAASAVPPLPAPLQSRPPAKPPRRESAPIAAVDPSLLRLGATVSIRQEPIMLPVEACKTHVAFLGTTGSGKTTAALGVIEQLLERGVSVLLVDRKGDLARYASDAWWNDPASPDHARRAALRAGIDVAMFTPGNPQGRPLRLPVIPPLADATPHEREQLAKFAAGGLAAMMGYGTSSTQRHKESILQCAINLNAAEREVTLDVLTDTISRPDPELLQAVGALQRHFAPLSEDLQSLKIQRGALLSGSGEALDAAALLPAASARPRLSIINTSALAEIPVLQFWISRLLIELGRLARKRPASELQGVAFFDEADAYVPATSAPPTKEPMFDLLRRARSGGLGVLLATQNPGDFDYKARDLIGTWLVGRVAQDRAIEKMRNLLGPYPNVSGRLANQATGHFFMLTPGKVVELKCDRSLMSTEQLADAEIAEIARRSAGA